MSIHASKILILDFGSQYAQLIARRIREIGVYCEIYHCDVDAEQIRDFQPAGIILSGGPESVTLQNTPRAPQIVFELGVPVLGICYGMQTMAEQLGGKVESSKHREFGYAHVEVIAPSVLLDGIYDEEKNGRTYLETWMSHGDHVAQLPADFISIAKTDRCSIIAMAHTAKPFYGLQFHPEVFHTKQGAAIFKRFALDICHCQANWTPNNIIDDQVAHIRKQVGNDKVMLGLSGGVDSAVAALLLHRAIGAQLICVFVDTGLLRLHEREQVEAVFAEQFGIHLITVDASAQFYQALKGLSDPEAKRKAIGKTFIDVFSDEARKLKDVRFLAQGTIYSDVIESAATKTGKAHVIKSHHNVGGLPADLNFELIEPLRELFKDEVRKLGLALGLNPDLVYRHPFPGPGLGVRMLGEIEPRYLDKLRDADAIFIEELRAQGWYEKVSQAFAVFLPVKSVGVIGDGRQYDHVIALRAVETIDFMTARWAELPYALLGKISNRIVNEVSGVSRVVYDISGKPPATIEWE